VTNRLKPSFGITLLFICISFERLMMHTVFIGTCNKQHSWFLINSSLLSKASPKHQTFKAVNASIAEIKTRLLL